ncbi:MAG: hypothetical protein DDG60_12400 [Anaerolineae bacterium]|nr:MAG: hypothetical protein DDG60_12400 [Anaerolineae bacterium]
MGGVEFARALAYLPHLKLAQRREGVQITPSEWRWSVLFALLVSILISAPYLVAIGSQTEAWRFGGVLVGAEDLNSYFAKMNQGAHGAWLFTSPYTAQAQSGIPLYLFYLLLGKLSGPDFANRVLTFHLARVVCGIAFLLLAYRFMAEFLSDSTSRKLALFLVTFGGGLGWLVVFFPTARGSASFESSLPLEFFSPEAFSLLMLFSLPHLLLARSLLICSLLAYLKQRPVWAGLVLGVGVFIQPAIAPIVWGVLGMATLLEMIQTRPTTLRQVWAAIRSLLVVGVISLPPFLYFFWLIAVQKQHSQYLPTPPVWQYALAFGLYAPFALRGWKSLWHTRPELARWLSAWVLLLPILFMLPLGVNRRLVEGFYLPLVAVTVLGFNVQPGLWLRRLRLFIIALLVLSSSLFMMGAFRSAALPAEPAFLPQDKLSAFAWLNSNAPPGAVVFSSFATGNQIPAYTHLLAYAGHAIETPNSAEKHAVILAFFNSQTHLTERLALLTQNNIRFLFYGPEEQQLGQFNPSTWPALKERFRQGAYSIYEVDPGD